ncbi:MAG: SDR family NAD(P)-dependent oxidoreductase [Actinomycetota bacterium]|nr:SDR family NAD(P)-dependent oxidoreductase [Actinomycetota bacterium]
MPPAVALVTGAASGMGQLTARRLAASGASVAALDVDEKGLEETVARAPTMRAWPCDVTDDAAVDRTAQEVEDALGPVERLVHAAGICLPGLLTDQPVAEIQRTMDVNYLGTVRVVHAVLPGMLDRRRGDVVTFASLSGWLPTPHLGAYAASKHAVVAFNEVLAYENRGCGVRFACVCPPIVDTPMVAGIRARDRAALGGQEQGIDAGVVLDAVEQALDAGELLVLPGRGTKTVWRTRRFAPRLLWRQIERATRG